jgi:hypothetical protein
LRGPLVSAVAEPHRARQPVAAVRMLARWLSGVGSFNSSQPASGSTRMVSLPSRLSASPSAVKNHRSASQRCRHCPSVSLASSRRWCALASRRPPRTTLTRPCPIRRSMPASRDWRCCSRCCLAFRSWRVAYPRVLPHRSPTGIASRRWITRIARRRSARASSRFRQPRCHWSLLVRVIAPAHRDDDAAVRARLRPVRPSAPDPTAQRRARSTPASRPRYSPTICNTTASCSLGRSRVRTRAPAGGATTNDARNDGFRTVTGRTPPHGIGRSVTSSRLDCVPTAAHTAARRRWPGPRMVTVGVLDRRDRQPTVPEPPPCRLVVDPLLLGPLLESHRRRLDHTFDGGQ